MLLVIWVVKTTALQNELCQLAHLKHPFRLFQVGQILLVKYPSGHHTVLVAKGAAVYARKKNGQDFVTLITAAYTAKNKQPAQGWCLIKLTWNMQYLLLTLFNCISSTILFSIVTPGYVEYRTMLAAKHCLINVVFINSERVVCFFAVYRYNCSASVGLQCGQAGQRHF